MHQKIASVLIFIILAFVLAMLYPVLRNALSGLVRAGREGRYLHSTTHESGFEPDTALGWALAIISILLAVAGLIVLLVHVAGRIWF